MFLGNITEAFVKNPSLTNLLLDDFFKNAILKCQVSAARGEGTEPVAPLLTSLSLLSLLPQDSWRKVVSQAVLLGIPTPCFSTALAFFDGYR